MTLPNRSAITITVLVASLGYFVDIFDLQLFNIISKSSLQGLGITDPVMIGKYDYSLFLWQMGGMLAGGLIWGIVGDKVGRKSILFGSILLYSLANIGNAFVTDMTQYSIVRFIAGFGLAGELGAAITLVSEIMHKEKRGYGTMVVVTMGALGAVAAVMLQKANLSWFGLANWQTMYLVGGVLGLLLLLMRVGTFESGMFDTMKKNENVRKGDFLMLFNNRKRMLKYLACIAIGLPVWYCIGILIKFSEGFATTIGVVGPKPDAAFSIMYAYIGLSVGDLISGILSQIFRSRKKIVFVYFIATSLITVLFLTWHGMSTTLFYFMCFAIGTATGYWALFVTMAAEQFGTNIRATVASTTPNFVRGAVIPIVLSFKALEPSFGNVQSAFIIGGVCMLISLISLFYLKESFGKDLDYSEIS